MSRVDGRQAAGEAVEIAAKLAAAAAYRAPQLTGRMQLRAEVLTGEDLLPMIEYFEAIAPISPVMYFDWKTFKHFQDAGNPPAILLLGSNVATSELGWDCGACGFKTCAEFNRHSQENGGQGLLWGGPSCNWKLMDFSAACDFACAAVAQQKMDCRAMGTVGKAAMGVGYLPDCSIVVGLPIGPPGDLIYFSRQQNLKAYPSEEKHLEGLRRTSPVHWLAFPGNSNPSIKNQPQWYANPEFGKFEALTEEQWDFIKNQQNICAKIGEKHKEKIQEFYKKKK